MPKISDGAFLGLDVGTVRIGVALMDKVKIAYPLTTLQVDGSEYEALEYIIKKYDVGTIVVGFPRNQSGEPTAQTDYAEKVGERIRALGYEVRYQDESLTSVAAEEYLKTSKQPYQKADIDARAAAIILDDFIKEHNV